MSPWPVWHGKREFALYVYEVRLFDKHANKGCGGQKVSKQKLLQTVFMLSSVLLGMGLGIGIGKRQADKWYAPMALRKDECRSWQQWGPEPLEPCPTGKMCGISYERCPPKETCKKKEIKRTMWTWVARADE